MESTVWELNAVCYTVDTISCNHFVINNNTNGMIK